MVDESCGELVAPGDAASAGRGSAAARRGRPACAGSSADTGPARAQPCAIPLGSSTRWRASALHSGPPHGRARLSSRGLAIDLPHTPERIRSRQSACASACSAIACLSWARSAAASSASRTTSPMASHAAATLVTVFSHDPKPPGAAYDVVPLQWRRFVDTWIGRRVTMGYLGNLLWLLPRVSAFDVLLTHGDSLLLPLTRKPFVRVMHGSARGEAASATSIGRFLLQAGVYVQELASAALHRDGAVAVSENARQANRFIRRVIPNGVDRRVFHPGAAPQSRAAHAHVRRRAVRPEARRMAAGRLRAHDPPQRARRRAAHGVPARAGSARRHAITLGSSDTELAALYCRAWLYVSPSTYEGFGLPYAEALACGTPVVATPNDGSREMLAAGGGHPRGRRGIRVDRGGPARATTCGGGRCSDEALARRRPTTSRPRSTRTKPCSGALVPPRARRTCMTDDLLARLDESLGAVREGRRRLRAAVARTGRSRRPPHLHGRRTGAGRRGRVSATAGRGSSGSSACSFSGAPCSSSRARRPTGRSSARCRMPRASACSCSTSRSAPRGQRRRAARPSCWPRSACSSRTSSTRRRSSWRASRSACSS